MVRSGISEHLPISDGLGNVCAVIDASDGSLAAEYDYAPYGALVVGCGPAMDVCPFRHRTRYYDPETWLYYYGYRYYDPSVTKWISKDPLGEAGGWNLTCFCGNDPVNKFDALGLFDAPTHINLTISALLGLKNRLGLSTAQFYDLMRGAVEGSTFPDTQTRIPSPYGQLLPVMQGARRFDQFIDYPADQAKKGLKYVTGKIGDATAAGVGLVWGDYPEIHGELMNWWKHGPSFADPALSWSSKHNNKAQSLYQTHYGDLSWQHGMGDATMTAAGLQAEIINGSLSCMNGFSDCASVGNCYDAGFELGKTLHYLQDTYTPSHAQRDASTGLITAFYDYVLQSPTLHAREDKPKFGGSVYNAAVQHSQDLIMMFLNGSPEDISGFFMLDAKATIGLPGEGLEFRGRKRSPFQLLEDKAGITIRFNQ